MKNLIYKELKLTLSPALFIYTILTGLILIPAYPYAVSMLYSLIAIHTFLHTVKSNKDLEFTAMLPVPRSAIVASKHISIVAIQLAQIISAIPFAIISSLIVSPHGNLVGMDANFAFFGYVLIQYAVFNTICMPIFFRTGSKLGLAVILGFIGYFIIVFALEILTAFVPVLKANLDSLSPSTFGYQLIVLAVGILVFVFTLFLSYKISVKNFERVNL